MWLFLRLLILFQNSYKEDWNWFSFPWNNMRMFISPYSNVEHCFKLLLILNLFCLFYKLQVPVCLFLQKIFMFMISQIFNKMTKTHKDHKWCRYSPMNTHKVTSPIEPALRSRNRMLRPQEFSHVPVQLLQHPPKVYTLLNL